MEIVFYDEDGEPMAYTEDGTHIYLYSGEAVAYFDRESVYSFSGEHLGWFINGWVRDNDGDCVFFTEHATSGPAKPLRAIRPIKAIKEIKPLKAVKEPTPHRPVEGLRWSELGWEGFFRL